MIISNKSLLTIILISLSVSPAIFLGEGNRNLLLIAIMFIMPFLLLRYFKIEKIDILLIAFMLTILLFPIIFNTETLRLSTVMYSILFCILFITYKQVLYANNISIEIYLKLLKYIIYAYFITLLIQQLCVLTGLPIFNVSNYAPSDPWKLNSLSAEASHTARIVPLLMYSYITLKENIEKREYNFKKDLRKDKYIWISFLWIILTSGSGTAYLFLGIIFLKFIKFKNVISLIILIFLMSIIVSFFNLNSFERTFDFAFAVLSFDINIMMQVDHSASMRVAPLIVVADNLSLSTLEGWFGNGIDSTKYIISKVVYGIQDNATGGGFFQIWYEYGFITFVLFILYSFKSIYDKKKPINIIFWFFLVFMAGVNTQMGWLCITLLYTLNYYKTKGNQ